MATIQIRDIPEDAYETIRKRARAEGRSIQGYMRDRVVELAGQRTKTEALAVVEAALTASESQGVEVPDILADLAAERR